MSAPRTTPPIALSAEDRHYLEPLARSRTAPHRQVVHAQMLLAHAEGQSVDHIAQTLAMAPNAVRRCVAKALALGPRQALEDLPRT